MKIQTMSIVVGSMACQAECPYCVSRCTGFDHLVPDADQVNWRNFDIACRLADRSGVSTVLLTGKGEPTLYPDLIRTYLTNLKKYNFPFIELQTNGITITQPVKNKFPHRTSEWTGDFDYLPEWYDMGMTTICLSMAHYDSSFNRQIYQPKGSGQAFYMNLDATIEKIHAAKLNVRLSCIMLADYIDTPFELDRLIEYSRKHGVKQLTVRPMTAPENNTNEVTKWIQENHLSEAQIHQMQQFLQARGTPILELAHGATIYDVQGQNVCWSTCLTNSKSTEDIRQIIFYPDGTISHSWQYGGAVLL